MKTVQRNFLIAGNWKMNLVRQSAQQLTYQLLDQLVFHPKVSVALCPPSIYLHEVGVAIKASFMGLGAQNMHAADEVPLQAKSAAKCCKMWVVDM